MLCVAAISQQGSAPLGSQCWLSCAPQHLCGPQSCVERAGGPRWSPLPACHSLSPWDGVPRPLLMAELQAPWRRRLVLVLVVSVCGTLQVTLLWLFCWFLFEIKLLCQKSDTAG